VENPLTLFSDTLKKSNAALFIKQWHRYISSTNKVDNLSQPNPHLYTIKLFHNIVVLNNEKFKKRKGLEFAYLAYTNPSFRQAIESNTGYTDYIFETFATWCEVADLTELTETCFFHDDSLLKKVYVENERSTGDHKN